MSKEYNYLVFIGRFQPFHLGHKNIIDVALKRADNVIVLIGSSNVARCHRNPFTFDERKKMILDCYPEMVQRRTIIQPIDDVYNNQVWIAKTQETVTNAVLNHANRNHPSVWITGTNDIKIGLIGHKKDDSSYYLKLFPEWGHIDVPQQFIQNATDIRKIYFAEKTAKQHYFASSPQMSGDLPNSTWWFLNNFMKTDDYAAIVKEYEYVAEYKKSWENAPYPPIHVTTDAVVIQSGHVLVVRRKSFPGQGLMALPGGFLNPDEYIEDGMIRELREETRIKVPAPVLRGNIKKKKDFDAPFRSSRGRTITHAFLIELPEQTELPKIKAGSDAAKAWWMPLADLKAKDMFEDHYHIITDMVGEL